MALFRPAAARMLELLVRILERSGMLSLEARYCLACAQLPKGWDRGVAIVVYLRGASWMDLRILRRGHGAAWPSR